MTYTPQLIQIDSIVATCALAWLAMLLLWRQQRQRGAERGALRRLEARLAQEHGGRQLAERALADTRRQVCHLSNSQQSLRDADRRRIARDLHDDLGQQLLAMSFELAALAARHPALRPPLEQLDERVALALRSMRSIVRDLRPEALDAGLRGALEQQAAQFSRLSGIACRLDADTIAADAHMEGGMDKVVYRIVQESLSNVARHARASEVEVGIRRGADRLSVTVRDNGVGIGRVQSAANVGSGAGLRGMAERVAEVGGQFDVASAPGRGTALTMSFPLP